MGYTQPCLRVVSWWSVNVPLVVWGLCFGKVVGVISCLVGPVRGYPWTGPQCPPIPPSRLILQYLCCNSQCAGGLALLFPIWWNYPVLSGVLCELKYAPGCPQSTWSCCWSSFFSFACGYGSLTCSPDVIPCLAAARVLTPPLSPSLPHLLSRPLNSQLWKANWHLLLRCWPVAPYTSTMIIILPCWSSMNIWTSWITIWP